MFDRIHGVALKHGPVGADKAVRFFDDHDLILAQQAEASQFIEHFGQITSVGVEVDSIDLTVGRCHDLIKFGHPLFDEHVLAPIEHKDTGGGVGMGCPF